MDGSIAGNGSANCRLVTQYDSEREKKKTTKTQMTRVGSDGRTVE